MGAGGSRDSAAPATHLKVAYRKGGRSRRSVFAWGSREKAPAAPIRVGVKGEKDKPNHPIWGGVGREKTSGGKVRDRNRQRRSERKGHQ